MTKKIETEFPNYLHPEASLGVLVVGFELNGYLGVFVLDFLRRWLSVAFGPVDLFALMDKLDVISRAVVASNRPDETWKKTVADKIGTNYDLGRKEFIMDRISDIHAWKFIME